MAGPETIEEFLIIVVIIHIFIGIIQFLRYPSIKRYVDGQTFPDKSYPISVIVPVKGDTPTLKLNFMALCSQAYPDYEVIFVSELEDDPGAIVAREVIKKCEESRERAEHDEAFERKINNEFGNLPSKVSYVCAGEMQGSGMIAKSHNLINALNKASGDVYLFTDSDVFHPHNWIQEMVNPLGEDVRGKTMSASTAVFFIDPEGFLGIFPSLSTNVAVFLASFTRTSQDVPSYASGASMAVFAHAFKDAGVMKAWQCSLNDDLVLASNLIDNGYHIFNVRRLPTRPVEKFGDLRGMNDKMVRWMLTAHHYTHPSFHREVYRSALLNCQFQMMLNISLIFLILDLIGLYHPDWSILTLLVLITYAYNVITRAVIARLIKEKNVYPYLWLSPISQYFWGTYLVIAALLIKKFTWGGRVYHLNKRFGRLVRPS